MAEWVQNRRAVSTRLTHRERGSRPNVEEFPSCARAAAAADGTAAMGVTEQ